MKTFTLVALDGQLYFPTGGNDALAGRWDCPELPSLLLRRYREGDCDTCPWPMEQYGKTANDLRYRLASALYDEREMNCFWPITEPVTILLPDGQEFDFDTVLHAADCMIKAEADVDHEIMWERIHHGA